MEHQNRDTDSRFYRRLVGMLLLLSFGVISYLTVALICVIETF